MLNQLESQPEYGGDSGSDGCGDDEPGDDEDGGEDEEDEDDNHMMAHDRGDYRHDNPKGGKILRSTSLALVLLSPSEENKNIDGFGFVSPQKPLDFSDLKKSLLEVEVMHESPAQLLKSPAELLQSPSELLAKDKNVRFSF
ncbi:hypothetical protein Tco_1365612, partial [Tanacetum coccineum]